jgi:hypothetical protein
MIIEFFMLTHFASPEWTFSAPPCPRGQYRNGQGAYRSLESNAAIGGRLERRVRNDLPSVINRTDLVASVVCKACHQDC